MPDLHLSSARHRVQGVVEQAGMLARLGRDLPRFLRTPITFEDARRRLGPLLNRREARFLAFVDQAVYGYARSPYRRLLAHAGCERGDLHALVAQEGLEGALRVLADRGVYVTFDELKGRREVMRGSARFTFAERDFDHPRAGRSHYALYTGGSGGPPSEVRRNLSFVAENASIQALVLEAYGVRRPRNVFWNGGSPTATLAHLKLGNPIEAWYYPIEPLPPFVRAGILYLTALARLAGQRIPPLEFCDLRDPEPIVRRLLACTTNGWPAFVNCTVSSAVRIASTAEALGQSLAGVTFRCRSEPTTGARREVIEQVGARVMPDYGSVETGFIAFGCPAGIASDDLHLCSQYFAVTERERPIFEGGPTNGPLVDALLVTTMGQEDGKIAINAELGDSARIERRDCGCLLGELGLTTHLSEIRSFEKLSSEGTTFARSNVTRILEAILPARFGGTALDYQIVEEESGGSKTTMALRISPTVGPIDEAAVRATLLAELARDGLVDAYYAQLIERASSITIERLPPLATRAGKVLPIHLARVPHEAGRA